MMDLRLLAEICEQKCGLERDKLLVVGVSGGADSLTLVDVLSRLGYRLLVAHFDHQLREESRGDADYVCQYAQSKGLLHEAGSGDVAGFSQKEGLSIEESARRMRYEFLFEICRKHGAQALAVGHTADDQVETVLMHMLRGAGLAGMKGMLWRGILEVFDPNIPIVRPLLGIWRVETEEWCLAQGIEPRIDSTNRDTAYARNRLREEIIPLLESYSPQARQHIRKMTDHLQGDYRILSQLAEDGYARCLKGSGEGYRLFDRAAFKALDPALQTWILRKAAFQLVSDLRDFDAATVMRCLQSIASATDGWQGDLPGGLRIRVAGSEVALLTWQADLPGMDWPQIASGFSEQIPLPGELDLGNDWFLRAEQAEAITAFSAAIHNDDPHQAWIDVGSMPEKLLVRRAAPGQRFSPLGMSSGSQKLSDFWVNVRLPKKARVSWPVVFSGEKVVWLVGFRLAQDFRLTANSLNVIKLILYKVTKPSEK
ncbi:MAG: tRNA lysidine(34) synthetase TilS [Anaerolineaceae bacterium]|nr:tRNA lysidine(34) synthetase TilS [Anaerolineaceae bacterium]